MAEPLDRHRLQRLHGRANRSEYDLDRFARAALVVVPEVLAELDAVNAQVAQLRGALERARELNNRMAVAVDFDRDELAAAGMDLTDVIDEALAATDPTRAGR